MNPNEGDSNSREVSRLPVNSEKHGSDSGQALEARRTEINAYPIGSKKYCVLLPRLGRPFSEFADDMGRAAITALGSKLADSSKDAKVQSGKISADPSNPNECFLCRRNGVTGMIVQEKGVARQHSGLVFNQLTSDQAITELERWIQTGVEKTIFGQKIFAPSSMTRVNAVTLMASSQFHQYLPKVERIFDFGIPYGFKQQKSKSPKETKKSNETTAAQPADTEETIVVEAGKSKLTGVIYRMKPGFNQYTQSNGEIVHYYCNRVLDRHVSLKQALRIIEKLFEEFTFADEMSRTHAIARLLTPYCQGLMGWRKRSPLWIFTADKPRAGKDYLAMLTPLVHSHWAVQDPPLETDDEVKRRITAALASGRRFMHFANCRNDLDNHPSLEAAITSEFWSDRIIRSSNEVTVPNEIIFSLSYNESLPISPDLAARSRQIRLLGKPGEANAFKYKNSKLHDMVTRLDSMDEADDTAENGKQTEADKIFEANTKIYRRNILAAMDALIRNWAENNCPHGPVFTSFPEWSQVVGGIMIAAGLGNPCLTDDTLMASTVGSWKGDITTLAAMACAENEKKFFTAGNFFDYYIKQFPTKYPVFQAYIEEHNPSSFIAQLGKQLKRLLGVALQGDEASYVLVQHDIKNPVKYRFVVGAKKSDSPQKSTGVTTTSTGGNFNQYTLPEENEQNGNNDSEIK